MLTFKNFKDRVEQIKHFTSDYYGFTAIDDEGNLQAFLCPSDYSGSDDLILDLRACFLYHNPVIEDFCLASGCCLVEVYSSIEDFVIDFNRL